MQKNWKFKFAYSALIMELDSYKAHVKKVDSLLEIERTDFEGQLQSDINQMDELDAKAYVDFMHEEHWELLETLPSIQRKSELISMYTILENGLNQVCKIFQDEIQNPVKLSDLSSHGIIDKSKKYLEKVALIKFPSGAGSDWEEIIFIQQIRNAFVHNEGLVKEGNKKLITYINNSKFFELKADSKLLINKGFSWYCLQVFQDFFTSLFSEIDRSTKI
ncbi:MULTISPECIES: hypothetical protein [Colwellia]|uniref:RiboL-PSP-HEPN domain-containing protein n=1 Tax=Colwellia marinimaniae TaxID=1513592 RepID=A0ABQ0MY53_9GAMM|nr:MULTISPECIES: hypothetical protein [Colwellia]GAW97291.1 hypothetical protein MTCD1_02917 [Colwellia marinimaniae]